MVFAHGVGVHIARIEVNYWSLDELKCELLDLYVYVHT